MQNLKHLRKNLMITDLCEVANFEPAVVAEITVGLGSVFPHVNLVPPHLDCHGPIRLSPGHILANSCRS